VDQVSSWAQVDSAGTSITVWVAAAPRYRVVSGADAYSGTVVLDSPSAQGAKIPVSIHVAYQNLNLIFAFGFLAAFGGFTWAWLLHNATHGIRKPGYFWRHSLLCLAVLLAASIPIVDAQVLNKSDWQGTLTEYIALATLIGGAAIAATPTLRALALPTNLAEQAPVVTEITATPGQAGGGTNVSGHVTTSDDGFWFVQYGSQSGDYQKTQVGGALTAKPGDQDIATAAPIANLATGNFVRIGFTTNNTGQTAYIKEIQVL
jgi:hypothetical protein